MKRTPPAPVTAAPSARAGEARAGSTAPAGEVGADGRHGGPLGLQRAHHSLSERELQVMSQLAAGRSIREIAASLGVSEKTVSTYRTRLLEKLCMRSNEELARYVRAFGLAP